MSFNEYIEKQVHGYIGQTPVEFTSRIDSTLAGLPERRRTGRIAIRSALAVAAAAAVFFATAAASPAFAKAVGLGNIFTFRHQKEIEYGRPQEYQRYGVAVQEMQPIEEKDGKNPKATLDMGEFGSFDVEVTDFVYDGATLQVAYQANTAPLFFKDGGGKLEAVSGFDYTKIESMQDWGAIVGFLDVQAQIQSIDGQSILVHGGVVGGSNDTAHHGTYVNGVMLGGWSQDYDGPADRTITVEMKFTARMENIVYPMPFELENYTLAEGTIVFDIPLDQITVRKQNIEIGQTFKLPLFDMTISSFELLSTESRMKFKLTNIDLEALKPYTQNGVYPPTLYMMLPDGKDFFIATKWVDTYDKPTAEFDVGYLPRMSAMPDKLEFYWASELGGEIPGMRFTLEP